MYALHPIATEERTLRHVRNVPILLQESKIERRRKSRESRCLDVSTAAMLARPDTKVRRRFCVKRCGPSRRRVRTASAVLKTFVHQPEKTFSTVSANRRQSTAADEVISEKGPEAMADGPSRARQVSNLAISNSIIERPINGRPCFGSALHR